MSSTVEQATNGLEIAIIGMEGRFPGAKTLDAFWQNLREGIESIATLSEADLDAAGVPAELRQHPAYVPARPVLDDVEMFDAPFFGFTPREAELMDPQQRVFLECAWSVLEHAGYDPTRYAGAIGVYAGVNINAYLLGLYAAQAAPAGDLQTLLGNDKDYLTTRVSYKLNLRGPSVAVQTACSSSLVAVHLACRGLLGGECDMALAGGVSIGLPQGAGYLYQEGGLYAPDGHCRAFDARAGGTVFGNGVGLVVLKRLEDALADRDTIHAVIKGSAINNDGAAKVGYTAPGGEGQAGVIRAAHSMAEVAPETISYVEAHGTGTPLGDPIEIAALTRAFRAGTQRRDFCAVGSVKTNVGHLNTAAGVAGLIKTVLALRHRQIPPSLHFEQPNPTIDFAGSPFYVNAALSEWRAGPTPRRAGVSSFGVGGTNAHVVIEEAPPQAAGNAARPWHLLLLSARTETALAAATVNLRDYLTRAPDVNLADMAYTLQVGRKTFAHRRMLVGRDRDDALAQLEALCVLPAGGVPQEATDRPVAFMFPGGGAQYVGMAADLYREEPIFRAEIDRCAALLLPRLGYDVREVLYPEEQGTKNKEQRDSQEPRTENREPSSPAHPLTHSPAHERQGLTRTSAALPALFAVEYALAKLWMAWGVRPEAMIGHSLGEYVAACLAGVFTLEEALAVVLLRGRLFERLPRGEMLSVPLPEQEVAALMPAELSFAAINGPAQCVVSGPSAAIEAMAAALAARGVECRRLAIDVAAHSALVEPILEEFAGFVATLRLRPPTIPFVSNVSGAWITAAQATDPRYWADHLRQTVRFGAGVSELLREPDRILLEVGPGQTLSILAKQHVAAERAQDVLTSIRHPRDHQPDGAFLLAAAGRLWMTGGRIDWAAFSEGQPRRRIPLPTYPFERQRYWIDARPQERPAGVPVISGSKKADLADWFYLPSWKRSMPPRPWVPRAGDPARRWLLFADACGLGEQIWARLEQTGQEVIAVVPGVRFARIGPARYTLDPGQPADYAHLIEALKATHALPDAVIHLWSVTPDSAPADPGPCFEQVQERGFYSLIWLAQALDRQQATGPLHCWVVGNQLYQVESADLLRPEKVTILGPCKVIPQEYQQIRCACIDVRVDGDAGPISDLAGHILAEIAAGVQGQMIAYRGAQRWIQAFEPLHLPSIPAAESPLRAGGVYLIIGGLGSVGSIVAEYLARTLRAKLILVGRTALPPRADWESWPAAHAPEDSTSRKLRVVLGLEQAGAEVLLGQADVADAAAMRAVIVQAYERFGALHGVIHAAGITSQEHFTLIREAERATYEFHFRAKVYGLCVLANVLQGRELDFCALCSSNASVLGGLTFAAYTAAHLFMDSFATRYRRPGSLPWISTNWDRWLPAASGDAHTTFQTSMDQFAMQPHEAVEAFMRVLSAATVGQIVVSAGDLAERMHMWLQGEMSDTRVERGAPATGTRHPRPALRTVYAPPESAIEQAVVALWQELLGIEPIGVHDSFFELGGHSLLATQVIARLRDMFQVEVPLRALFEASTVAQIAQVITELQIPQEDDEALELLRMVEQLSDDEVTAEFMKRTGDAHVDRGFGD